MTVVVHLTDCWVHVQYLIKRRVTQFVLLQRVSGDGGDFSSFGSKGWKFPNYVTMCRRYCWALLISWKYMVASPLFLPDSAGTFFSGWYFLASSMYPLLTCLPDTLLLRVSPSILKESLGFIPTPSGS